MGCCNFRIYSLVLGVLEIVFCIVFIVTTFIAICLHDFKLQGDLQEHEIKSIVDVDATTIVKAVVTTTTTSTTTPAPDIDEDDEQEGDSLVILITWCFSNIIYCILASLLVAGIIKERPNLMRPYIFGNFVIIGLFVLGVVIGPIKAINANAPTGEIALRTVLDVIFTSLTILIFVPVYILYERMRETFDQSEQLALKNNTTAANRVSYVHGGDV